MKNIFNLDLDGLFGDLLLMMKRELYRTQVIDRKDLEIRKSNGDKLDTADEAKLNKLSAAHERTNNNARGYKRRNVIDRKDLEIRKSNGEKLDTADEAKLSKLTAAHESKKKADRERAQRKKLEAA